MKYRSNDVYYYQQISHQKSELVHIVPWGGATVRNCLQNGEILQFKTLKEYELVKKATTGCFIITVFKYGLITT